MKPETLAAYFLEKTGLEIWCVTSDSSYSFHFGGLTESDGVFLTLELKGLMRHLVSLEYGSYSKIVRDLIREAPGIKMELADSMSDAAFNSENVKRRTDKPFSEICTDASPKTELLQRSDIDNQAGDEEIWRSLNNLILPLILALAELVGHKDDLTFEDVGEEEGLEYLRSSVARERSPRNRAMCLMLQGSNCKVCGFDASLVYGPNCDLVEVHHLEPLSCFQGSRVFNPMEDLVPLCPNCHRAIHKRSPPHSLSELKSLMGLG